MLSVTPSSPSFGRDLANHIKDKPPAQVANIFIISTLLITTLATSTFCYFDSLVTRAVIVIAIPYYFNFLKDFFIAYTKPSFAFNGVKASTNQLVHASSTTDTPTSTNGTLSASTDASNATKGSPPKKKRFSWLPKSHK